MLKVIPSLVLVTATLSFSQFVVAQQFVDISKGGGQICGVTAANELICSTSSAASRLEPPAGIGEITQVEVGNAHACGLKPDGQAVCWGDNNFNQLDAPASMTFVSIDAGWNHTCAITADFESVCWGLADNGRLDVPTDGLPFVEIDASLVNTCGLEAAGGIRCWGVSEFRWDPPSADADIQSFAASATNAKPELCALLGSGSIECDASFLNFTGLYTDLAAYGQTICALSTSRTLECQGFGSFPDPSIDSPSDDRALAKLFSGQGLCVTNVVGGISCSAAVRTPGAGFPPVSNFISLPSAFSEALVAVDNLTANVYSDSTIELMWSSDGTGGDGRVVGAQIFRDGALLIETAQSTSYLDTTLEPGINYSYELRIINDRGDVGPLSNLITVNTTGRSMDGGGSSYVQPSRLATPASLNALVYSNTVAELVWDRADHNVFGYEIYRDHEYVGFISGNSYFDDTLMPGTSYHYNILAVNQNGDILGFAGIEVVTGSD